MQAKKVKLVENINSNNKPRQRHQLVEEQQRQHKINQF
jgi:hypothetical protein